MTGIDSGITSGNKAAGVRDCFTGSKWREPHSAQCCGCSLYFYLSIHKGLCFIENQVLLPIEYNFT